MGGRSKNAYSKNFVWSSKLECNCCASLDFGSNDWILCTLCQQQQPPKKCSVCLILALVLTLEATVHFFDWVKRGWSVNHISQSSATESKLYRKLMDKADMLTATLGSFKLSHFFTGWILHDTILKKVSWIGSLRWNSTLQHLLGLDWATPFPGRLQVVNAFSELSVCQRCRPSCFATAPPVWSTACSKKTSARIRPGMKVAKLAGIFCTLPRKLPKKHLKNDSWKTILSFWNGSPF